MFPGWRRTKSASSISHPDRRMDMVISQLTSKPVPLILESPTSRPDTPTNSPTKPANRANSISPIRNKPSSPYLSSRDKMNRKRRSQTGPPSISPTRATGEPPSRTQSDLPHLSQALNPPQHHNTATQLQSISSSSGILSSGSIFSAYADSTSSVATSGSEQVQPTYSDLDQAITRHEAKSPQTRPTNLAIPPNRRLISAKTPSPHKSMHLDLTLKSPHKLHLFWGPQQIGSMSYDEKFTRPFTETSDGFIDPSLVTVPSHLIPTSLVDNQTHTADDGTIQLKQTPSVDSLASSTVHVITSIREEIQDLIGNSSATSMANKSDSSPDMDWAQKHPSKESINLAKQSWGSGSVSRMLDFCYSYLEDEVVGSSSSPASPITPQANNPDKVHYPLRRSRALSTPEERTVTFQRSNPLSTVSYIPETSNRDIFLLTSNIIPVPTASAPSPLIPPAHRFSLQRLHSLPSKSIHSSTAGSSSTNTFTDHSDNTPNKYMGDTVTDNAPDAHGFSLELRDRNQTLGMRGFRRKSSSFSSITSEIQMEEGQNSETIFCPRISNRRKRSLERLESLEVPMRENIAFKAELRKYVIMNLFDTEMSYVRSLESIIKDNGERLTLQIQLHNPLLLTTLESLLSHLTLLFNKHKSFLMRIEAAYKNYNQMTTIGGIIWQHFSQPLLLETYLKYIQCYQALIDTLRITTSKTPNKQKKNPNTKDPFEKLTLTDLLIQPIQRPSRYPLIIKDLQKQSIPGSSEFQQLANAMQQVGNFTMKMNAFLKKDIPSGPEVLKELEMMIDGLENLTKPNRGLLRLGGDFVTETKSPTYYLSPRRDKCIFLFSDLIILCSSRPKSGSLVRASSFTGESSTDLAKRKLKLIWEASLHKVAIENCDSQADREKTKADKHVEKLIEDEKRMNEMLLQMQDFNYGNNNLEKVLTESLHILQGQIYEKRLKLPSFSAYLTLIDLESSERRIIVFADEKTKLDWVKAYREARSKQDSERQELSWSVDRKETLSLPNFLNPLMLMESRSGMEATCACQVETTRSDITTMWVCRSDKFGGQVVEVISQNGAPPNVNASYTVSASPILCLTSVPETGIELNTINEELHKDRTSLVLQEEMSRCRPYSAKASGMRSVYARYSRPASGRYSAMSSYSESLIESATISKCSSTSNLSDLSSSTREYRMSSLDQLDSSFSNSQWNDSPFYIETSRRAGDLISMVSGSVTSLASSSDYGQSLQSLVEQCNGAANHWVTSSMHDSINGTSKDDLTRSVTELSSTGRAVSEESLVLPKNLMKQITQLDDTESRDQVIMSKYERFGIKQSPTEVTHLDSNNKPGPLDPIRTVQKLIQQFSPEKRHSTKIEDTENENFEDDALLKIIPEDNTLETQSKAPLPSADEPSRYSTSISPDITHNKRNSKEFNRLWLESSFNKSNPQIQVAANLPQSQAVTLQKHSVIEDNNMNITSTRLDTPDNNKTDKEIEKKGKVEKKTSFNKILIPKIFSHRTRNSNPKTRDIPPFTSPASPNTETTLSQTSLAQSDSGQSDHNRPVSRNKFKIDGPTVWVGTESGGLIVFQSDANIRTQSKHTIRLTHPACSICYHRSKVFVGLGNGHLIIFSYSKVSQEWAQSEKRQVSPIDHRILCITSVQQETLWVAEANRVHVFAGDVFKFPVKKFSLWPKQRNSSLIVINQMVYDGNEGVWVCLDREPTLHLYSILTFSQILQVDCMEPSLRLIKDKILYKHMSDQFRISSVHAAPEGTWVGTSSGILAFISTPEYDARECEVIKPPNVCPSYHGHTAGIKFIIPWKHKFIESNSHEIIVTGGIGYEYRGNTKYPVEFERDIHNSGTVLIWSP